MEPCDDPYCPGRPARRTQWLVSALAHHYGLDRGAENEVIVLATGLDQYLQEIFHHLDWQGLGTIPGHDFLTLCQVLGLEPGQEEECEGLLDNLPPEMPFRLFHSRLCGFFSTRAAGCQAGTGRLPLGTETEHIETQIRLRSPLRRRDQASRRGHQEPDRGQEEDPRILGLEQEISSLRELVEDMRAALQSSDARCLALQVGLRKSQASGPLDGGYVLLDKRVPREVTPIQSSRDSQLEEAILTNKDLGDELDRTQKALECLEEMNLQLKREQSDMRRKAEDARQALLKCLGKVRDLEEKSRKVPVLQMHIKQLEIAMQDSSRALSRVTEETLIISVKGEPSALLLSVIIGSFCPR
ncbi:EF-hand and coiled-coil domain-containing protein 1, partial [Rhinophrynus dorsalis]